MTVTNVRASQTIFTTPESIKTNYVTMVTGNVNIE